MIKRKLRNLEVSSIGLGCMGFSQRYFDLIKLFGNKYSEVQEKFD